MADGSGVANMEMDKPKPKHQSWITAQTNSPCGSKSGFDHAQQEHGIKRCSFYNESAFKSSPSL
jgi:hypothetical protein